MVEVQENSRSPSLIESCFTENDHFDRHTLPVQPEMNPRTLPLGAKIYAIPVDPHNRRARVSSQILVLPSGSPPSRPPLHFSP